MIEVTLDDFSVDGVLSRLQKKSMGAILFFVGTVRDESNGRHVDRMEIQVYKEMAIKQLESIRSEALEKFDVDEVDVIHRFGNLDVTDKIMIIGVGAAHRAEAFDACRYVLENIKKRVPIWKKEFTPSDDYWVEGEML